MKVSFHSYCMFLFFLKISLHSLFFLICTHNMGWIFFSDNISHSNNHVVNCYLRQSHEHYNAYYVQNDVLSNFKQFSPQPHEMGTLQKIWRLYLDSNYLCLRAGLFGIFSRNFSHTQKIVLDFLQTQDHFHGNTCLYRGEKKKLRY